MLQTNFGVSIHVARVVQNKLTEMITIIFLKISHVADHFSIHVCNIVNVARENLIEIEGSGYFVYGLLFFENMQHVFLNKSCS